MTTATVKLNLAAFLADRETQILTQAESRLCQARLPHYQTSSDQNLQRLRRLFDLVVVCVRNRALLPVVTFAEQLASERYASGFDLSEVQAAFNILEEVIWSVITDELEPVYYPQAFGITSAVLGAGKQALAREYVSLASKRRVPSLDLVELFKGA